MPEKAHLEIRFPRVECYTQGIRHRVRVDWDGVAPLRLDPADIPPEVEMKAGLPSNNGGPSLAFYARQPSSIGAFGETKLMFNIGEGIKALSVSDDRSSLFAVLSGLDNGPEVLFPL